MRRFAFLPLVCVCAVFLLVPADRGSVSAPVAALYAAGARGYDVSYPQCAHGSPPPGSFGVVGVNHGRPFTANPCAAAQFAAAARLGDASLYLNVAYDRSYARHVAPECATPPAVVPLDGRLAWSIGCSEADYAEVIAPGYPARWWLDVERANSWARRRTELNRWAIQGVVDELLRLAPAPVGVYSSPADWARISGGDLWSPVGVDANWLAVATGVDAAAAPASCATTGFTGAPVVLVQYLARDAANRAFDADYAC